MTEQRLWAITRRDVQWTCELTFHEEQVGWEVTVRRDGLAVANRFFRGRDAAIGWAAGYRDDVERGWLD
jgi:hypothetical protein